MYLAHNNRDPALVICKKFWSARSYILILREESCYVAVTTLYKTATYGVMLKLIVLCINFKCRLECAYLRCLSHCYDAFLISMAEYAALLCIFLVKYVVFHFVFSSFIIFVIGIATIFERLSNHCVDYCLLFFIKCVEHVSNCFFSLIGLSCLLF